MKKLSIVREMLIGLLIGMFIMPPQISQAQDIPTVDPTNISTFDTLTPVDEAYTPVAIPGAGYPVHDWAMSAQSTADSIWKKARVVLKDLQEVEKYTVMALQLTNLNGMLMVGEQLLSQDACGALLVYSISQIISGVMTIMVAIESGLQFEITSLQSIQTRLNNGLFNPEQDRLDFENYLMFEMGRQSQQALDNFALTANADGELSSMLTDLQKLMGKLAAANAKLKQDKLLATQSSAKPLLPGAAPAPGASSSTINSTKAAADNDCTQAYMRNLNSQNKELTDDQNKIDDLQKQISDLRFKISERIQKWNDRLYQMEGFSAKINAANTAWSSLDNSTKQQILNSFSQLATQIQD